MNETDQSAVLLCPLCGGEPFAPSQDMEEFWAMPEDAALCCAECGGRYTKSDLLQANRAISGADVSQVEQAVLRELEQQLAQMFE